MINRSIKHVKGITPKIKAILYLDNTLSSAVFYKIFFDFYTEKKFNFHVQVLNYDKITNYLPKLPSNSCFDLSLTRYFSYEEALKYAEMNEFNIFYHQESIENILSKSIGYFCQEKPFECLNYIKNCNNNSFTVVNLFQEIKNKEIIYYGHINQFKRQIEKSKFNKSENAIFNYLVDLNAQNPLALYNIFSTLKKL
ncbi:hypothetical protein NUSPORA_00175 [Nucleospora cyclopteri]